MTELWKHKLIFIFSRSFPPALVSSFLFLLSDWCVPLLKFAVVHVFSTCARGYAHPGYAVCVFQGFPSPLGRSDYSHVC